MGPVPPPNAASTGCCVVLACAVGAGFSVETAFRGRTSNRGMGCENGVTPKVGLGDSPVGTSNPKQRVLKLLARALGTKGLRPPMGAKSPALVKSPI